MSVKLKVAGFALAGLVAFGVGAASATRQPVAPARSTVEMIQPASVATVAPTTVAPTTQAPAPVESTTAPAPVVAPTTEAPVAVKAPAPAPVVRATVSAPRAAGTYPDGSPFKYDSTGRLLEPDVAPAPGMYGNAPMSDGNGVPIPRPTIP